MRQNTNKSDEQMRTLPYQPKCSVHNRGESRCAVDATVWIYGPDGPDDAVPNGYTCANHAKLILDEYEAKLDEIWTTKPIFVMYKRQSLVGQQIARQIAKLEAEMSELEQSAKQDRAQIALLRA